jgi:hypothetical protein
VLYLHIGDSAELGWGYAAPVVVIVAAGGEPGLGREVHQGDQVAGGE